MSDSPMDAPGHVTLAQAVAALADRAPGDSPSPS